MGIKNFLPPFLVSLILIGCATPTPPSSEEALAQALAETTTIPDAFAEQDSQEDYVLPANWIKAFQDPQLDAIIDEVLANNLDLQAAAAEVEAAGGLVTQAGAQMKPVITAGGEGEQGSSHSSQGAVNISWELDIWGKLRAQTDAAEAQREAITADYEYARLSLKAQTARSWFMAVEIAQQLEFAQEVVGLYEKTFEIVEIKFEFGDVGMKEVHLARADLTTSKERLRQVEGASKVAKRGLEVLLGRYPSAELEVSNDFVAVPPPIPVGLPSELIERRPDLVAAERRVAAAFNMTTVAKTARLPSIGLSGSVGGANSELTDLLGGGGSFWSVGANFLAPIYSGGALKAEVEISNSKQEAALAAFGQQALVAFGEVENTLSNGAILAEQGQLLTSICEDNRNALELVQIQFKDGAEELLSVLLLQASLVTSQVSLINNQNAQLSERITLHLALGGDFEEPEEITPTENQSEEQSDKNSN
ncbi:MAG: efflux transporter outer membrane subunit [Opitutaceae bacterium]|nr:efflux transporter outer membrane subunit [Opitutaceae bacterium]